MLYTKRLRVVVRLSALSLMGLLCVGCRHSAAPVPTFAPTYPAGVSAALMTAHNDFGWNLFAQVTAAHPQTNVFLSPLGVSVALHIAYNGATGTTRQAMAQTLHLPNLTLPALNQENAALLTTLNDLDSVRPLPPEQYRTELSIANALWARPGVPLKPEFVQHAQQQYHAQVSHLSNDPAPINQWVKQKTHGKIASIVEPQDTANAAMVLVNAVYFKGSWLMPFASQATKQESFHSANGSQQTCAMMHQSGEMAYQQSDHFQALSMPFTRSSVSMLILLPDEDSSVEALIRQMSQGGSSAWPQQFHEAIGEVALPRFTLGWEADLKGAFTALGMGEAFSLAAHFDNMAPDLYLSQVKHKTYVKVDEKGTEAAAATAVGGSLLGVHQPPPEHFRMIVDRPFVCAIVDGTTNAILFLGAIYQPSSGKD